MGDPISEFFKEAFKSLGCCFKKLIKLVIHFDLAFQIGNSNLNSDIQKLIKTVIHGFNQAIHQSITDNNINNINSNSFIT